MLNQQLHKSTPTVVVLDNRGSAIREINYCRHPDTINKTDERITRHYFHARGYLERSIDARLYEAQQSDATIQPNIQQTISLSGALSLSQGIDNGNSVNLNDIEGTVAQQINGKGTVTTYEYKDPLFVRYLEQVKEGKLGEDSTIIVQKFKWAESNDEFIAKNQVGKCIEYFDTAGRKTVDSFSLLGTVLSETQQLHYGNYIDWSSEYEINELEKAEKFTTQYTYDATGTVLTETDSAGHQRRIAYDIAGFVKHSWLTLKGQAEQAILRSLTYSAAGQKLREAQGNGLVTTYEYEPETQRLLHVKTERPQGHALGAKIMQDLRYEYDAVGNIICLKNDAEATRYWRNQKVVPENRYVYDSLYQLISATGRESANQNTPASMQSQKVATLVKDTQSYTNYTRLYTYDRGGNLTQIRHISSIAQQSFTQDITVSNKTNRALLKSQCSEPQKVDSYFDESGNLTKLLNGNALIWDSRNHLKATNKVSESGYLYEGESYQYNSAGQRVTKIRGRKTADGHLEKVTTHYLPNVEVWEVNENPVTEKYAVVQINAGTSAKVRALCWEIGTPKGIENNSLRYSYDDGVGNSGLETDGQGQLVSYEEYYPYGGTAIWSSENAVEADYKTIRYSGKEKDSTGLYYYGYRYYQPWIGRWLSADPAGTVDGLNLFRMCRNNPVTLIDSNGLLSTGKEARKLVGEAFVHPLHIPVFEKISLKENIAMSVREAGIYTISALGEGAAAKGHNILDKTIKPSSLKAFYGDKAGSILELAKRSGFVGRVGKSDAYGIKGVYAYNKPGDEDTAYPISLQNTFDNDLVNAWIKFKIITPYTGDYDMHDIIKFSHGKGHVPTAESSEEREVKDLINKGVAEVDSSRPFESISMNVIRHGPQVNFVPYMWEHEQDKVVKDNGYLGVVARPGPFPVAMVHQSEWTIFDNSNELFDFYKSTNTPIPEHWSQDFVDRGNGMVAIPRHAAILDKL